MGATRDAGSTTELLEREAALAELGSRLDRIARDGGGTVLVSGEAGIGKTGRTAPALHRRTAREVRRGFPVRPQGCRALRRARREPQDGGGVRGASGVVGSGPRTRRCAR